MPICTSDGVVRMTRGDTCSIEVSCVDCRGVSSDACECPDLDACVEFPLDTGYAVDFTLRKYASSPCIAIHKRITEFSDGKAYVQFYPQDTEGLAFGKYVYDVQLTFPDGNVQTIVEPSEFIIGEEVTYGSEG